MAFIGNSVQTQGFTPAIDYFSGNGSTVTFTLSRPVASVAQMIVAIDNVIQNPSSSFTVSGSAITFSSAPLAGTNNIWVEYTSLITTYNAISQSPSVIGDITATGGYLASGSFNNTFLDGTIVDYVTGNGRVTVGTADGFTIYNGGTSARSALASWTQTGALTLPADATINGLTVGKGANSLATNTLFGSGLGAVTTGNINSAFGYSNLNLNTSGVGNSAFGVTCLSNNTTGTYNSAFGYEALNQNTTASHNSAFGYETLKANTTGASNVGFGNYALYSNTTASNNTAVGYQAGYSATTGANHALLGYQAGYNITTGQNNTLVGYFAGQGITTGTNNLCLGINCGQYGTALTTGAQNIYIGTNSGASSASVTYEMVIGLLNTVGKGSSTGFIQPQGGSMYQGNNSATWAITSDARLKKNIVDNTTGLSAITAIQVRNFEYRIADEITDLPKNQAIDIQGVQLGAIAQELKEILPDCVKTESTGVMSVDTTNLTWYLINAVKELKAEVDALKAGK